MSECEECGRESNDSMEFRLAALEKEIDLSKRVVTAHRKLCDERAAKIKELTAALAEAEAIIEAASAVDVIHFDGDETGHSQINVDRAASEQRLHDLLAARREKGGAK